MGSRFNRAGTWWHVGAVFCFAVLFNFLWERAQSRLFVGFDDWSGTWWHCFIASLGDGALVLAIYAVGWIVFKQRDWFEHPGNAGYGLMLITGMLIGVGVEWFALHVAGLWAYAATMPLVPGLTVGLVPVLQMLLLPPAIFRVVAIWTKHSHVA